VSARRDDLIALLAKVKAETVLGKFGPIMRGHWDFDTQFSAMKAYKGSLDAAKALHDVVLPGWGFVIDDGRSLVVRVDVVFSAKASTPARAWLIAILRALIAQDTTQDGGP
jgi:hypothetical protein